MFIDLGALLEFLQLVAELKATFDQLAELFDTEEPPAAVELTDAQRLQILKDCTLTVHHLRLDIACFPLTDSSVVFYDSVGEPIPLECLSP